MTVQIMINKIFAFLAFLTASSINMAGFFALCSIVSRGPSFFLSVLLMAEFLSCIQEKKCISSLKTVIAAILEAIVVTLFVWFFNYPNVPSLNNLHDFWLDVPYVIYGCKIPIHLLTLAMKFGMRVNVNSEDRYTSNSTS